MQELRSRSFQPTIGLSVSLRPEPTMFVNGDRADQILRFLLRSIFPSVGHAESKKESSQKSQGPTFVQERAKTQVLAGILSQRKGLVGDGSMMYGDLRKNCIDFMTVVREVTCGIQRSNALSSKLANRSIVGLIGKSALPPGHCIVVGG